MRVEYLNCLTTKTHSDLNDNFIKAVQGLLKLSQKIVIVSHKNPDGDAIGSSLGLALYLKTKGHQVSVVMPNDYPNFLSWIPSQDEIIKFTEKTSLATDLIENAQIIFTLDFNALSRVGDDMMLALKNASAEFIMIDHHQDPKDYTQHIYSDTSIGSTCQMIYHLIETLDELDNITADIATCLYTGIMTDSGNFKFPRTTSDTHRVVSDLIKKGADNISIHNKIFEENNFSRIRLLGYAISKMKYLSEYSTIYISLSRAELSKFKYQKGDTEGIVNFGLSVKGVKLAVIFTESMQENYTKISFRSKGSFPVNIFAEKYFQGGGHPNAAGGKCDLSLEETVLKFNKCLAFFKGQLS